VVVVVAIVVDVGKAMTVRMLAMMMLVAVTMIMMTESIRFQKRY